MYKIKILGKSKLKGKIEIKGAKNAALPIMASSLLSNNGLVIRNTPDLQDIYTMKLLLEKFGVKINKKDSIYFLDSSNINNQTANYEIVRKMRASILVLGPLIARFKEATISLPGGCAIGTRPIDIHLNGLNKLGVNFTIDNGLVYCTAKKNLKGADIQLPFPSVGATENILMAASLAEGKTIIHNAAKEPEIIDLTNCLNNMGAIISGAGTSKIIIKGVKKLHKTEHKIISDRIVAGTYIIAAIMLKGELTINNINPKFLSMPIRILKKMGANLKIGKNYIKVLKSNRISGTNIITDPYPGFPTDLQAQIMALMTLAQGKSKIKEKIFENRFMHVPELNRLGANIKIKNDSAIIEGGKNLKGAQVMASDLRASVSLILAGMCAEGETIVNRVYHLDRGYEKIEENLRKCGVNISRFK